MTVANSPLTERMGPQLCFFLQSYQVRPTTKEADSKQYCILVKSEHLPLFIGVPELLPWFLHIPPSFSSEHPHQRWGHLSCWTRKQLLLAAFPAGLTDLRHHSAEPEHGSAATASPLNQAATQCQAPRSPSCCESTRKTHLGLSGTHSSAARPTQYGCWGEQGRWVRWNYDGSSGDWQAQKPSKQRTRFSAILSCSDFRGSGFTSQVLPALGRKYSVQCPCAWPNSSFQTMRWAGLWRQRALRSHGPSLPTQSPTWTYGTGISNDCYLQSRQQREAGNTSWKHWMRQLP